MYDRSRQVILSTFFKNHLDMFRLWSEKPYVVYGDFRRFHLHWLLFSPSKLGCTSDICEVHTARHAMDVASTPQHAVGRKCKCCKLLTCTTKFKLTLNSCETFILYRWLFSTSTTARRWTPRKSTIPEQQCFIKRNLLTWLHNLCAFMGLR